MAISIDVRYYTNKVQENLFSYDLRVEVVSATEMPKEIFIFQRSIKDILIADRFTCIADPVDLEEVPVRTPDLADEMPYYRTSLVTLRFRDMQELTECQTLMDQDIQLLVTSLKEAGTLVPMTETVYA